MPKLQKPLLEHPKENHREKTANKEGEKGMMSELQKQLAYKYKGKQQSKHVWKGGQELEVTVKDAKLIVELRNGDY